MKFSFKRKKNYNKTADISTVPFQAAMSLLYGLSPPDVEPDAFSSLPYNFFTPYNINKNLA